MIGYGMKEYKRCRFNLGGIDDLSKFGLGKPFKNESKQTLKKCLEVILTESKSKPGLMERDVGKHFLNWFFKNFSFSKHIKRYSISTSEVEFIVETFNKTINNLFDKPVHKSGIANGVDELF